MSSSLLPSFIIFYLSSYTWWRLCRKCLCLIVPCVSSYRWAHFSRAVLLCQPHQHLFTHSLDTLFTVFVCSVFAIKYNCNEITGSLWLSVIIILVSFCCKHFLYAEAKYMMMCINCKSFKVSVTLAESMHLKGAPRPQTTNLSPRLKLADKQFQIFHFDFKAFGIIFGHTVNLTASFSALKHTHCSLVACDSKWVTSVL